MSKRLRRKLAKVQRARETAQARELFRLLATPSEGEGAAAVAGAPRIQDIASYQELLRTTQNLHGMRAVLPLLEPLLTTHGVDVPSMMAKLDGVSELVMQVKELTSLPDCFNDLFAARGWIMHESMSIDVARDAVALGEAGNLEGAEQLLVDYYSPEQVGTMLRWMRAVRAFRKRERLASLTLEDYRAGRHHACVPVVLAMLDGLVSELHEARRGFFAEDVDLKAWDSIAAHDRGLQVLVGLMQKGRRKPTTESIPVPYRHGILHGMDLGYDTPLVAAKTWAALFATREWAMKAERGELTAPPAAAPPTWTELLERHEASQALKARIAAWRPRDVQPGRDIPLTGSPDECPEGTPERAVVEFLSCWMRNNYGGMAGLIGASITPLNGRPKQVRLEFAGVSLRHFLLERVLDEVPIVTVVDVVLSGERDGEALDWRYAVRVTHVDMEGDPIFPGQPGGAWRIMNWDALPHPPQDSAGSMA